MMQSQNYSLCYLGSGAGKLVMHILSKKFVASHELTVSSSCLITVERLDNFLNHQIKSKMNSKRRTWKLWEHEVEVTVKSWYMASCITDRMHWLIYLENESCFPWKLCTPKTQLVTYCKHTAQYWSQKTWKSAWKSICSNCVYIPNFRQTEHLCRVPVEDLPQFIARSRFESAGNPKTFRTFEPFKFSNARFFYPYKQWKQFRTRSSFVR